MRKYTIRFGKAHKRSDVPHPEGTAKPHSAADSRLTANSRHAAELHHYASPRHAASPQHRANPRYAADLQHRAGPLHTVVSQHRANPRHAADPQHRADSRRTAGPQNAARSRHIEPSRADANSRCDEKNAFVRAALLALCGSIVCISFLAYSVAPREQPVVQVMARPGGGGSGDSAIPAISGSNDGSVWSYIENVIRGIIDDAGD